MPDIDDLETPDFPFDQAGLDTEWTVLNAFREMLGIASKGKRNPTYSEAQSFAQSQFPHVFGRDSFFASERDDVKIYRDKAEAESLIQGTTVTPLDILDKEITDEERRLYADPTKQLLQKHVSKLRRLRPKLAKLECTEQQILSRDFFYVSHLPTPPECGDNYRDYRISETRGLRLRLLHPDKPEHSTGADLIYEQYWEAKSLARIVAIQYKIWDGHTLYLSKAKGLEKQLTKLKKAFCDGGVCGCSDKSKRQDAYRLPFCSAFLRPTDKLQDRTSQLISTGLHVPICVVERLFNAQTDGKKLERKYLRGESLSQAAFAELFNYNMCGSKWLRFDELTLFYQTHHVLREADTFRIYAQEFSVPPNDSAPFGSSNSRKRRRRSADR
ncbi:MAG TPA: hypothetical protein VHC22_16325 [Pirellulales bacterium]|nr:hypothetical protein [Pirellulales bacterium]